ncbi:MAG: PH domain-containing protein, partial [Acidimicrobiales bacterium]
TLTVVVVAAAIAAFVVSTLPVAVLYVLLGLLALALIWLGVRYLGWATTSLVVTTERVVMRRGMLRRRGREILLDRVNDLTYDQTLGQRMVGSGRLVIESGGERGQEVVTHVARPAAVQRLVSAQMVRARRVGAGVAAGPRPASIPEQLEQLDDLCRRGIISRRELSAKRAQLLERW